MTFMLVTLLTACANFVPVPPATTDRSPTITIDNIVVGGTGDISPQLVSSTAVARGAAGTQIMIVAGASNPGGVKDFSLRLTRASGTIFEVSTQAVPDAQGNVPDLLSILGSDGAGHAGSQPIQFALSTFDLKDLAATASNFNGMTTTIYVHYLGVCPQGIRCPA